jgi:hypothetical protein
MQPAEDPSRGASRSATILIFPERRHARPRWWARLLWRLRHGHGYTPGRPERVS